MQRMSIGGIKHRAHIHCIEINAPMITNVLLERKKERKLMNMNRSESCLNHLEPPFFDSVLGQNHTASHCQTATDSGMLKCSFLDSSSLH